MGIMATHGGSLGNSMDTPEKIADTKRQLANPRISAARKRDLTKYLWRLQREQQYDRKRGSGSNYCNDQ